MTNINTPLAAALSAFVLASAGAAVAQDANDPLLTDAEISIVEAIGTVEATVSGPVIEASIDVFADRLSYVVTAEGDTSWEEVIVDAQTGEILGRLGASAATPEHFEALALAEQERLVGEHMFEDDGLFELAEAFGLEPGDEIPEEMMQAMLEFGCGDEPGALDDEVLKEGDVCELSYDELGADDNAELSEDE